MYHALLTRKYLTSKIMPLLAAVAVLLCTAMVLITWSVMGGFLSLLLDSGRKMVGDVSITWPNTGFAHYEDLIRRLEADPEIGAAAPMIETFAVVVLPDDRVQMVQLRGIDGPSYSRVIEYDELLWWRPVGGPDDAPALPKAEPGEDLRENTNPRLRALMEQVYEGGRRLAQYDAATGLWEPGIVIGIETGDFNERSERGVYVPRAQYRAESDGSIGVVTDFMPETGQVTLHLLPLDSTGRGIEIVTRRVPIANEFRTGLYDVDRQSAFMNLKRLQDMLGLGEAQRIVRDPDAPPFNPFEVQIDPETGRQVHAQPDQVVVDPARVTTVLVRAANPSISADRVKERAAEIYAEFARDHAGQVPSAGSILIKTWEDQNRTMVAAVRKETGLVLFIFGFISMTAVFLVLAIFWSMVAEKTKDVGILRALGASQAGVAWLWMRYGLAIGVVGSLLGGLAALLIVWNINPIHEWLGKTLGLYIWDPKVYVFTDIPSKIDPVNAVMVLSVGILSSLIGALIPAWRAARLDPVRALRFE